MSDINNEAKQGSMEVFFNGLVKENPTFVLALGMCPTLAVTTSAVNGLGMGLTTTAVLVLSNAIISLLRHIIPNRVRIPAFIVIVASFVTMVELLLEGFIPSGAHNHTNRLRKFHNARINEPDHHDRCRRR